MQKSILLATHRILSTDIGYVLLESVTELLKKTLGPDHPKVKAHESWVQMMKDLSDLSDQMVKAKDNYYASTKNPIKRYRYNKEHKEVHLQIVQAIMDLQRLRLKLTFLTEEVKDELVQIFKLIQVLKKIILPNLSSPEWKPMFFKTQ